MQGMLKNYTEFVTELGQSGMAMLARGQTAMVESAEDAVESTTDVRGRRGRQAA